VRLFLHIAHKFNYSRQGLRTLGAGCGFSVTFIDRFESCTAPELWALFRVHDGRDAQPHDNVSGQQMLRYLRRTELRYRVGLLAGYQGSMGQRIRRLARTLINP
jgi:hypothetical protein